MVWRKYQLFFLLSVAVLLCTFCFGVNEIYASSYVQVGGTVYSGDVLCMNDSELPLEVSSVVDKDLRYGGIIEYGNTSAIGSVGNNLNSSCSLSFWDLSTITFTPSLQNGDFVWLVYYFYTNDTYYWTKFEIVSSIPVPITYTPTRITSFTYSTTTNIARVQGYWNATSTIGITERLEFHQFSTLLGNESFQQVIATTTGLFDLSFDFLALPTPYTSTTTAPFIADTTLFARIYQYDNNYATDPFSGVFDSRYKTLLVSTTTTITQLTGIDISTSTRALFAYPEYECSISSLTGCFKNALIWAFYPTQEGVEQYYSFVELIESKAPIGYFFVARDAIQGLNKDGTPSTNITIPYSLKNYIFSPFDVGIASILWLFFLFNFYKRLKFITI